MIQTCQNCKKEFQITEEDIKFYERINVPPPTWCPECRLQRRMTFKNERTFYKRKCDLCGKDTFSIHPQNSNLIVYCNDCWWSDKWDDKIYGEDYDFSKPFFIQFNELLKKVPRFALVCDPRNINCFFINMTGPLKNCYFVIQAAGDDNCYYSYNIFHSYNSFDCSNVDAVNNSYELLDCTNCNKCFYSYKCHNCIDVYFSKDLINCSNCFGCWGLRNKKYHIFNKAFSKEEYFENLEKINFGSYNQIIEIINKVYNLSLNHPVKFIEGKNNVNVSGNYIYNSKNVQYSFDIIDAENCKYCRQLNMSGSHDCYDYSDWGNNASFIYDSINVGENIHNVKFSIGSWIGYNIEYSDTTYNSHDMFGCVFIKNSQYCILNKQYTKEEYEKLIPKIIKHMNDMPYVDKKGRIYKYGEFFPPELSPFCYNETIAQEYFPKTKEQALSEGYNWKEPEEKNIIPDIKTEDLPDNIKDIDESIMGKIIQCEHSKIKENNTLDPTCNEMCTRGFKIIKQELDFYKRMSLPIPRLCPNCRHFQRLKQRNLLKLWHRKCQCQGTHGQNPNNPNTYQNQTTHFHQNNPCPNEFETSYPPESPAIVYCEECYNQEVV
jgi:hypothetical protein